ncbi:helix-turn-helix transcriptional regulator [Streptomyces galbus]|uniref:Helix-turn-helix transcriptional regulator n=2 Tax=Streptomyces galbus TaxID=33898 RepID=A0A4U5X487_STRGB|nr:helix-turn-helix transcriptional regulator [Streptomyces galbus]
MTPATDAFCSIERTVGIVGDRWTLLILREVLTRGVTRFNELTRALGIAPNILTNRLDLLTRSGIVTKREYREEGSRARLAYHPTDAGRELLVVLAALGQWGDDHVPPPEGIAQTRQTTDTGEQVRLGFVADASALLPTDKVAFVYTPEGAARMRDSGLIN